MLQICSLSSSSSAIIKLSQEALQERVHINAGIFFTSAAALFSFITDETMKLDPHMVKC